jgi:hypothetical protein
MAPYAVVSDLYKGDLPLPAFAGDGTMYITRAADEMDTVLGQLYETPILLVDTPANRPALLWLKTCCSFIASGRLVLDLALNTEDTSLHAYGLSMLKQGLEMLKAIASGAASIAGAIPLDPLAGSHATAPAIYNEDDESLVEAGYFYIDQQRLREWRPDAWPPRNQARWYTG